MSDEDKHAMAVAIECDLYDIISEIEESTRTREDKKNLIAELIDSFISKYRERFSSVPEDEFRNYISAILQRTKNNVQNLNKDEIDDEER